MGNNVKPWGYIYQTTNKVNGKMYVGKRQCRPGGLWYPWYLGSGKLIKRAIRKYGKKSFEVFVIDWAFSEDELNEREKMSIAEYRAEYGADRLYNLNDGGEGASGLKHTQKTIKKLKSYRHSEATKKKMSRDRKGHYVSDLTRAKQSAAHRGRKFSEETRRKIGLANAGRKLSAAHKLAIRKSQVGRKNSSETIKKMRLARLAYFERKRNGQVD